MKRLIAPVVLAMGVAVVVVGVGWLFQLRVVQGDVFPPYSTLRADPVGLRAWHDALSRLPDLRVERRLQPLRKTPSAPARTIIVAGASRAQWTTFTIEEVKALEAAVRAGSRLVFALRGAAAEPRESEPRAKVDKSSGKGKRKSPGHRAAMKPVDLGERWGIEFATGRRGANAGYAAVDEAAATALPPAVAWRGRAHFIPKPDTEWRVLYRRDGKPVLLEMPLERGSVVLAADSYFLSNEALQRDRATSLLAWLVGPHRRVQFEESHLGVVAEPGIAALARRYGMGFAFFTLLLLAVLFVWQRMAGFVPPPPATPVDLALKYHPAAGLEALLRRSVPVAALGSVCLEEWRRTASSSDQKRVDVAVAALPAKAGPVLLFNAVRNALRRR